MARAAVLQLFHEANAFSPARVGLRDFQSRQLCAGVEVKKRYGHTRNWLGGVLTALDRAGHETEIGLCTACLPGGPLNDRDYADLSARLIASLDTILAHGPVDLVCLLLHGALLVDGIDQPEGRLTKAVRDRVGANAVIGVTLDFHANIDPLLEATADILVGGQLYPHTDTFERGAAMVRLASDKMAGKPLRSAVLRFPILVRMPHQTTVSGPFAEITSYCEELGRQFDLDDIALMGGFPYSTVDYAATSLVVTSLSMANTIGAYCKVAEMLRTRAKCLTAGLPGPEDLADVLRERVGKGRLVLADVGDNPGGGGLGNTTSFLSVLLSLERPFVFGALVDPSMVECAIEAGKGCEIPVSLGAGDLFLHRKARVERTGLCNYRNTGAMMTGELVEGGPAAVLRIGQGTVLVVSERIQAYDSNAFTSQGIDLASADIIAVKSSGHFRASYAPLAEGGIVLADSGGYAAVNPERALSGDRPWRLDFSPDSDREVQPKGPVDRWSEAVESEIARVSLQGLPRAPRS